MLDMVHFNASERQQVLWWEYAYQFPTNLRSEGKLCERKIEMESVLVGRGLSNGASEEAAE